VLITALLSNIALWTNFLISHSQDILNSPTYTATPAGSYNRVSALSRCNNNGVCDPSETFTTCPNDCRCGNGICDSNFGETRTNCPDCFCGDGVCESMEIDPRSSNPTRCYNDCSSLQALTYNSKITGNSYMFIYKFFPYLNYPLLSSVNSITLGPSNQLYPSVVFSNYNLPSFSFTEPYGGNLTTGQIRFTHCSDLLCVAHTDSVIDGSTTNKKSKLVYSHYTNYPIIIYTDTSQNLKKVSCTNEYCNYAPSPTIMVSGGVDLIDIKKGQDGFPYIVYSTSQNYINLIRCSTPDCNQFTTIFSTSIGSAITGLDLAFDIYKNPIISYVKSRPSGTGEFNIIDCTDKLCSIPPTPIQYALETGDVGPSIDLVLNNDGWPVFAYTTKYSNRIYIGRCSSTQCDSQSISSPQTFVKFDPYLDTNQTIFLVNNPTTWGTPSIGYLSSVGTAPNYRVSLASCILPDCSTGLTIANNINSVFDLKGVSGATAN